ncbi:hypothetical protein COLO4_11132 [Corchorus olitorius]|uniref:Uncharacterized protein n=1 Tax=Corchorus olitorius TaxID=93759 RepID=A0A1R3K5R6_9ROSI|nr:hypothetical protein COLO4_11132 [Corchorus olitorius]
MAAVILLIFFFHIMEPGAAFPIHEVPAEMAMNLVPCRKLFFIFIINAQNPFKFIHNINLAMTVIAFLDVVEFSSES